MVKKFHINEHNEVVKCKSYFTKCSFRDYTNEFAARRALADIERNEKHEKKIAKVKKSLSTPYLYLTTDFSIKSKKFSPRDIANLIDQNNKTLNKTEEIQTISTTTPLHIYYADKYTKSLELFLNTLPVASSDRTEIINKWYLTCQKPLDSKYQIKTDTMNHYVDSDSYENFYNNVESIIREILIQNMKDRESIDFLEDDMSYIMEQSMDSYTNIEEEVSGFHKFHTDGINHGTFEYSMSSYTHVEVNYNNSFFRAETFNRFWDYSYHVYFLPDFINIQVYDNENGESSSSWRLVKYCNVFEDNNDYERQWVVQTVIDDGEPNPVKVKDAAEAYKHMYNFVRNHMKTNTEEIAREKAQYCFDLINAIDSRVP